MLHSLDSYSKLRSSPIHLIDCTIMLSDMWKRKIVHSDKIYFSYNSRIHLPIIWLILLKNFNPNAYVFRDFKNLLRLVLHRSGLKMAVCNAGIPYRYWFKSRLFHFQSSSLLICIRRQRRMNQISGLLNPCERLKWSLCLSLQLGSTPSIVVCNGRCL